MFLHSTREVQVTPYDRGKPGTNEFKFYDTEDRLHSPSSKPKLSLDQYNYLENKGNHRSERKKYAIPKLERELTDAYIDSITRTPRYGLGRHKTYDEILLSMSSDDPFGKKNQSSTADSLKDTSIDNSTQKPSSKNVDSTKPSPKTSVKPKHNLETPVKQSTTAKLSPDPKSTESPRNVGDKKKQKQDTKTTLKSLSQKQLLGNKGLSAEKSMVQGTTSRKPKGENSNVSVSTEQEKVNNKRKISPKSKLKPVKKPPPRYSRIPVFVPKSPDAMDTTASDEYKYQPLGTEMMKDSKIPVMKKLSVLDIEKRLTLITTNKRWKDKLETNKPSPDVLSKSPDLVTNRSFISSPGRSVESHIYGSSLGSPWRRADTSLGLSSSHSMYPVNQTMSAGGGAGAEIANTSELKSVTLNECDYKELKEITALAFGQRSKTMFDDYRKFANRETVMTPKREQHQPTITRELSDVYIDSISRTPRYGLGRHKTYDEILTSLSQADPFNGNYQPSGKTPREKTNISLKKSSSLNKPSEGTTKSKG